MPDDRQQIGFLLALLLQVFPCLGQLALAIGQFAAVGLQLAVDLAVVLFQCEDPLFALGGFPAQAQPQRQGDGGHEQQRGAECRRPQQEDAGFGQ